MMLHRPQRSVMAAIVAVVMLTLLLFACIPPVERDPGQPVTLDPGVLSGELPNGFRYYLRSANSAPENDHLEVRLIVKAGSLDEGPAQRGYAHLVEHMAYRGTESYSLKKIESLLSDHGLRWGSDVNATTHYGATVYRFSLHRSDENLLPEIFALMSEWLDSIQFDTTALAKEKRIVDAEWRERYAARNHIVDPVAASAYEGSHYDSMQPAGDLQIVRTATAERLQEFWKAHYRADNAVLVVTGGVRPWRFEPLISSAFSALNVEANSEEGVDALMAERDRYADGSQSGVKVFKDGALVEILSTTDSTLAFPHLSVNLVSKFNEQPTNIAGSVTAIKDRFRGQLLFSAFSYLLRDRISTVPECSAVTLDASLLESGQAVERITLSLTDELIAPCLSVAYDAVRAVQKYTLTTEEYANFEHLFQRIAEVSLTQYRNRNASALASGLVDMVTNGEHVLSAYAMQTLFAEVVDSFDRDQLNAMFNGITESHKLVFSAVSNLDEPPTMSDLVTALDGTKTELQKRRRTSVTNGVLKPDQTQLYNSQEHPATASSSTSVTRLNSAGNVHEWRLANGASVILLQDAEYDQLAVTAISEGGYDSYSGVFRTAAQQLPSYLAVNGVDGYTSRSLRNIMQQKQLHVEPYVEQFHHGVAASGGVDELVSLLSMVRAYFGRPLILEPPNRVFLSQLQKSTNLIENAERIAGSQKQLDRYRFLEIHHKLFGATENFGFIFVGMIEPEQLERELYRLDTGSRSALPTSHRVGRDASENTLVLSRGKVSTDITLTLGCGVPSRVNELGLSRNQALLNWQLLSDVVAERLRYALREELGLVYEIDSSVPASVSLLHQISFAILSEDEAQALSVVRMTLAQLSSTGVSTDELNAAQAREVRRRMTGFVGYESVAKDKAQQWLYSRNAVAEGVMPVAIQSVNWATKCLGDSVQQMAVDSPKVFNPVGEPVFENTAESALQQNSSTDR